MTIPRWLAGLVVLWICAISAASGIGWRRQEHTNDDLTRIVASVLAAQRDIAETRSDVLCPLYEVFLQSDTPQRRAAVPPEDLERYEHAIDVIRAGAATLHCLAPATDQGG